MYLVTTIALLVIIIVFTTVIVVWKKQKPQVDKIVFVTKPYMKDIIRNSQYFQRMSNTDLFVRSISSTSGYEKLYIDNIQEFTQKEREQLRMYIDSVDRVTSTRWPGIHAITWKFCKLNMSIENGWPHTLGDVIVLSRKFFEDIPESKRVEILLHEKIHVYQRQHPIATNNLIKNWGMQPIDTIAKYPLARNNPDINNFVYALVSSNPKVAFIQLYDSARPRELSDSSVYTIKYPPGEGESSRHKATHQDLGLPLVVSQYEHPYEIMATLIPPILLHNYSDGTVYTKSVEDWIKNN